MKRALFVLAFTALTACQEEDGAPPSPIAMTDEAIGHYCQMYLADHGGPKAQIHLKGYDQPLWFSQVSDAAAYLHDPEQIAEIKAVYVSDMALAPTWAEPGIGNWIAADQAQFVIGSRQMGGMGMPEAIPFGTAEAAAAFVAREGGQVVSFETIPPDYVHPGMGDLSVTAEGGEG
jgi:copper chaperone NosL